MKDDTGREHWMIYEGGRGHRPGPEAPYAARFESLGLELPDKRLTTEELLAGATHHPNVDLERLTGIRERHVCSEGEDSFTLALAAARDCLERSRHGPGDIEMLVSCSISKNHGGLSHRFEPPLSLSLKKALGAEQALSFDLSNACAGMLTGVFVLDDFIRRGVIERGMVVSGEWISGLGLNAAHEVRTILSKQLASLTLGDAGVAAIVERAPEGNPGIVVAGFTTLADHSRLCIGVPSKREPGAVMYTDARGIHKVAIEDSPELLRDALEQSGFAFDDIDWVIPHQTSARAIEKGTKHIAEKLGVSPKNVLVNVEDHGNTASTTHFVALYEYLRDGKIGRDDKIMLISFASGLEVGVVIFTVDELVERNGRTH